MSVIYFNTEAVRNTNFEMIRRHIETRKPETEITLSIRKTTVRRFINKVVRNAKRGPEFVRLGTGIVTTERVYNNKKIIEVSADIKGRFLRSI